MEEILSSASKSGGVLGSIISWLGTYFLNKLSAENTTAENDRNLERQKELTEFERAYNNESARMERMIQAGLTPSAAAQSIAGTSSSNGVATFSNAAPSPLSTQNLGDTFFNSKLKDSEILVNEAQARQIGVVTGKLEQYYDAQIDELRSRAMSHRFQSNLFGEQAHYYGEYTKILKDKAPWEILTLAQGLSNLTAEYREILARTRQANTQADLNVEKINTEKTLQRLNESAADLNYAQEFNLNLFAYRLQFENSLMSCGINPSSRFGDNLVRIMCTDPTNATVLLDNMSQTAVELDGRLQSVLGENYKSHLKRAGGLYLGYKAFNTLRNNAMHGLNSFTGALGNIMPFAHPAPGNLYTITY